MEKTNKHSKLVGAARPCGDLILGVLERKRSAPSNAAHHHSSTINVKHQTSFIQHPPSTAAAAPAVWASKHHHTQHNPINDRDHQSHTIQHHRIQNNNHIIIPRTYPRARPRRSGSGTSSPRRRPASAGARWAALRRAPGRDGRRKHRPGSAHETRGAHPELRQGPARAEKKKKKSKRAGKKPTQKSTKTGEKSTQNRTKNDRRSVSVRRHYVHGSGLGGGVCGLNSFFFFFAVFFFFFFFFDIFQSNVRSSVKCGCFKGKNAGFGDEAKHMRALLKKKKPKLHN
jgi:hypothetical protein